jgi:hypothetical protein
MAIGTREKNNKTFVFINTKKDSPDAGMFIYENKQKKKIDFLSGELIHIVKKLEKPEGYPSYWAYWCDFQDGEEVYSLQLKKGNDVTDSILNALAAVEDAPRIHMDCFKGRSGYVLTFLKRGSERGEKISWKYQWSEVPEKKYIPVFAGDKPVMEGDKQKVMLDREDRDNFFYEVVKKIYLNFTGQQWSAANVIGDNDANVSNKAEKPSTPADNVAAGLLAYIKKNYKDADSILNSWSTMAGTIKEKVQDYNSQLKLTQDIQEYLNSLSDKKYDLSFSDGKWVEQLSFDDDLPF